MNSFYGCSRTSNGNNYINPVMSAKVTTVNSFAFKYGRVEVKAKLPKGNWLCQLFGFFQEIRNMEHGQQAAKSILWKVEVMLDIHNQLEEDLKALVQPCIGVQIGLLTNSIKLTQFIQAHQVV
jgi:hypothetical protein